MAGKVGFPKGKKRGPMSSHHRKKISDSKVVSRLIKMAEGELDPSKVKGSDAVMTGPQVTAAVALLNKVVPNLSSQEIKADINEEKVINKVIIQAVKPKN